MIKQAVIFFFSFLITAASFAQKPADEGRIVLYRTDIIGGFIIHTEGWGGYFRYGKQLTYNSRINYSLDIVSMHHPKETKVFNPSYDDGKGYYFGKLNSLYIARPGIGIRKIYFEKIRDKGVEISLNYSLGPSIGFLKPVYLQILNPIVNPPSNPPLFDLTDERYNPYEHTTDNIFGRSKGTIGLGETKINPGAFGKFGIQFEYANEDDAIRSIELGAVLDFYVKPIELMAENKANHLFLSLYLKFLFGRKYY